MVLDNQLLGRLAQVPEEAFRDFEAADHTARHDWQVAQQIIAPPPLEFLAKPPRPVLRTHLPAINVQHGPAGAAGLARPKPAQERLDKRRIVRIERRRVELVALKAQARQRRRAGGLARGPAAETQHRPVAVRHVPLEPSVGRELAREVQDLIGCDALADRQHRMLRGRGQERLDARLRRVRRPIIERLFIDIGNPALAGGRGKRQHRNVAVEVIPGLLEFRGERPLAEERRARRRPGQGRAEVQRAGDVGLAGDQVLHGLLGADPWPAAAAPAGTGVEGQLQAQALGLLDRVPEESLPLRAHELDRPARNAHIHLHQQPAAKPGLGHRLQVGRNPLPRHVAIHEKPIRPRPRLRGRIAKARVERRHIGGGNGQGRGAQGQKDQGADAKRGAS